MQSLFRFGLVRFEKVSALDIISLRRELQMFNDTWPIGLHHLLDGSTSPRYGLLRFDKHDKIKLAKTSHLSYEIIPAIYHFAYI